MSIYVYKTLSFADPKKIEVVKEKNRFYCFVLVMSGVVLPRLIINHDHDEARWHLIM
jgi:hypothetical protein